MADGALMQQQGSDYWAAFPVDRLVGALDEQVRRYFAAIDRIGLRYVWRLAYAQRYGMDPQAIGSLESQEVMFSGAEGENIVFRINDFASFLKQSVTLAIGQRPSFRCLAVNDDYDSLAQIESCDSALTYIYNRAYGEDLERGKVEMQKIFGWSWDWHRWDDEGGDDVQAPPDDPDAPLMQTRKSGAPTITPLAPFQCAHDVGCLDGRHRWWIGTERRSKWELAAKYPVNVLTGEDQAQDIMGLSGADDAGFTLSGASNGADDWMVSKTSDAVLVKHFYHARTAALPDGRYVGIVGGIVLWDWPLPDEELPCVEFMPARIIGTAFGYSDMWDLLPSQQMKDQIISDMATSAAIYGRPNMVMDEGTSITVTDLAKGGKLFTKKPMTEAPKAIEYPQPNEQPMRLLQFILDRDRENTGNNAATRGDPNGTIKSGQQAALYHAIAIEYAGSDQQAVDASRTKNANLVLTTIKANAQFPFMIEVAGQSERPYASSFETDKLSAVKRVQVVTANPLQRTQAGRLELFNATKDIPGAYSSPSQVTEMLISGQYKEMYQAGREQKLRVKWENEQLAQGIDVPVLLGENPFSKPGTEDGEVAEHLSVLANPAARRNPQVVQAVLHHVMQHEQVWSQSSPFMCAFLDIPPPPVPGMGMAAGAEGSQDSGQPTSDADSAAATDKISKAQTQELGVTLPKPAESPTAAPM